MYHLAQRLARICQRDEWVFSVYVGLSTTVDQKCSMIGILKRRPGVPPSSFSEPCDVLFWFFLTRGFFLIFSGKNRFKSIEGSSRFSALLWKYFSGEENRFPSHKVIFLVIFWSSGTVENFLYCWKRPTVFRFCVTFNEIIFSVVVRCFVFWCFPFRNSVLWA